MTEIERVAITRQGEQLARAFGIQFKIRETNAVGMNHVLLPADLENDIHDHLRIIRLRRVRSPNGNRVGTAPGHR